MNSLNLDELRDLITTFYPIPSVWYCWDSSPRVEPLLDQPFIEFVELTSLKDEESAN